MAEGELAKVLPEGIGFDVGDIDGLAAVRRSSARADAGADLDDVAAEVADLEAKGVVFEDYDLPGLKTVDHVCVLGAEKAAWFKDSEGNIMAIIENGSGGDRNAATAVMPRESSSGLARASRMATASSCPGSVSMMIFCLSAMRPLGDFHAIRAS